eukprot:768622-Hanusia_phi.AAC.4
MALKVPGDAAAPQRHSSRGLDNSLRPFSFSAQGGQEGSAVEYSGDLMLEGRESLILRCSDDQEDPQDVPGALEEVNGGDEGEADAERLPPGFHLGEGGQGRSSSREGRGILTAGRRSSSETSRTGTCT